MVAYFCAGDAWLGRTAGITAIFDPLVAAGRDQIRGYLRAYINGGVIYPIAGTETLPFARIITASS